MITRSDRGESQSGIDINPPLVVHVEDENAETVAGLCEQYGIGYSFAKTYMDAATIIGQARARAQDVMGVFDLNTKGKYQVDGDMITEGIKASTMKGVTKTPVMLYTGEPERGLKQKKRVRQRFGDETGFLEVVSKSDTPRLVMFLIALKRRILAEVAATVAPFEVLEEETVNDKKLDNQKKKDRLEKIRFDCNKRIAATVSLLEREPSNEKVIAALAVRSTSSISPLGN